MPTRPLPPSFHPTFRARHALLGLAAAVSMTGVIALAPVAQVSAGGTFNVTTTGDGPDTNPSDGQCHVATGACSLRAAIQQANASGGTSTINLPAGVYPLNASNTGEFNGSHSLQIGVGNGSFNVTINGAGASNTRIVGNAAAVFNIARFYGPNTTGVTATINNVTITGGSSATGGGVSLGDAVSLTMNDVVVDGNSASTAGGGLYVNPVQGRPSTTVLNRVTFLRNTSGGGGAIANPWPSVMTINDSVIALNSTSGAYGGGILNGGTMTVNNTTISYNAANGTNSPYAPGGGGVYTGNPGTPGATSTFTMNGGLLDSNATSLSKPSSGGGLLNEMAGTANLNAVIISNNSSYTGGGVLNDQGAVNLTDSTIVGNSARFGGGLYNNDFQPTDGVNATMVVQRSVVFQNVAHVNYCLEAPNVPCGAGGGVFSENGQTTIINSTIAENAAGTFGGGIYVLRVGAGTQSQAAVRLKNATVAGNSAGTEDMSVFHREGAGILNNGALVEVKNSIVTNNTGGTIHECFKVPVSPASVITTQGNNIQSDGTCWTSLSSDRLGAANLGPLANNGGETLTMMPKAGSLALNAGDNAACAAAPVFNVDQRGVARPISGTCDIGAVEGAASPPPKNKQPPVRVRPRPQR